MEEKMQISGAFQYNIEVKKLGGYYLWLSRCVVRRIEYYSYGILTQE